MVFLMVWVGFIVATAMVASHRNLSVGIYFVLAIFLGPLALIIALLASPPRTEVPAGSPDLRVEIAMLRQTLARVETRIRLLEDRLNKSEGGELTSAPAGDAPSSGQPLAASRPSAEREGLEMSFGRYWLNRIGVVLFVVGMGFFISYSLHYMPKVMKILSGFILSGVFFFWGSYLEKFSQYRKIGWGILGGAWGLLYLTTFAMHHIRATRIIEDPLAELLFLAAVTAVVVGYNLKYRSQTVTGLTFLLALLTAGFGGVEISVLVYWSGVIMAAVYLAWRLQWPLFMIFAVVSAWVMNAVWFNTGGQGLTAGEVFTAIDPVQYKIMLGLAAITWFVLSKGLLFLPFRNRDEERYVILGTVINAVMFANIGEGILRWLFLGEASADAKIALFFLGLGMLHMLLAWGARIFGKPRLIVVHAAVALFMTGLAGLAILPQTQVALLWLLETVVLFLLGVYYQERWYRTAAVAVSLLVTVRLFAVDYYSSVVYSIGGLDVKHKVLAVGLSAVVFFLMGTLARKPAYARRMTAGEVDLFSCAPIFSTVLVTILLGGEVASRWRTLGWTLEGAALLVLGFFLNQRVTRVCALFVLSLAVLRLLVIDMAGLNTLPRIFAFLGLGAVLVAASFIYTRFANFLTPQRGQDGSTGGAEQ